MLTFTGLVTDWNSTTGCKKVVLKQKRMSKSEWNLISCERYRCISETFKIQSALSWKVVTPLACAASELNPGLVRMRRRLSRPRRAGQKIMHVYTWTSWLRQITIKYPSYFIGDTNWIAKPWYDHNQKRLRSEIPPGLHLYSQMFSSIFSTFRLQHFIYDSCRSYFSVGGTVRRVILLSCFSRTCQEMKHRCRRTSYELCVFSTSTYFTLKSDTTGRRDSIVHFRDLILTPVGSLRILNIYS